MRRTPRLDDRRRLDRDPEEPHRRAGLRPPLRPAGARAAWPMPPSSTVANRSERRGCARSAHAVAPRSVALIGASDDPSKTTARPLEFLRQARLRGPRLSGQCAARRGAGRARVAVARGAARGARARLHRDADRRRDRGGRGVRPARRRGRDRARRRLRRGGRAALAREARLREIVRATGMRLVGPSSLGVVEPAPRRCCSPPTRRSPRPTARGRIFVASHSGSMIGALLVARQGARHRLRRPGVGRQRGRPVARRDLRRRPRRSRHRRLPAVPREPAPRRRAARISRSARRRAASRWWPTSSAARRRRASSRVSHTGALAGEDDVADAFLARCGIARVDTFEALLEGLPLLERVRRAAARAARRASRW